MCQDANVAGRNYVTDDRWGGFMSTKWTPTNDIKITDELRPHRPQRPAGLRRALQQVRQRAGHRGRHPAPDLLRLRQSRLPDRAQDFGTLTSEYKVTTHHADQPDPRRAFAAGLYRHAAQHAQRCNTANPDPAAMDVHRQPAEPQPVSSTPGEQDEATFKFDTGRSRTRRVVGLEVSNERVGIDRYNGLSSEALGPASRPAPAPSAGQSI